MANHYHFVVCAGALPLWRPAHGQNDELRLHADRPRLDWHGMVQRPALPKVDAVSVARAVASVVDIPVVAMGERHRAEQLQRARHLVMLVGVEQGGLEVKDLAVDMGRGAGTASRHYAEAAAVRRTTPAITTTVKKVTAALREQPRRGSRKQWGV